MRAGGKAQRASHRRAFRLPHLRRIAALRLTWLAHCLIRLEELGSRLRRFGPSPPPPQQQGQRRPHEDGRCESCSCGGREVEGKPAKTKAEHAEAREEVPLRAGHFKHEEEAEGEKENAPSKT